jgi:hypothetical protein
MATTFMDKLYADAFRAGIQKDTKQSRDWFRKKLQKVKTVNRKQLLKDDNYTARSRIGLPGRMFMYFYDPKTKKDLPYYDRFPLIFMVEKAEGGFYGLNLHYLAPRQRAIFFDRLLDLSNNKKYDESTRLRMKYRTLKASSRLEMFKPCFKHYLSEHVRSQIVEIPASEWESVLFLPTEYFMKGSKSTVWSQSRKMI